MHIKIQKWGNSLACRIPHAFARKADIAQGVTVDMDIRGGTLIISPVRNEFSLEDMLAGVSPSNLHREESFGASQGRENL
jgi:antitoxin MazE